MNQKFSWAMFAGGMPTFLLTAGEMLKEHNEWSYFYQTPLGFLHAVMLGVTFCALIVGAIGIQLPRTEGTHAQRKSDQVTSTDSPDGTVTTITTTKETTPVVKETP